MSVNSSTNLIFSTWNYPPLEGVANIPTPIRDDTDTDNEKKTVIRVPREIFEAVTQKTSSSRCAKRAPIWSKRTSYESDSSTEEEYCPSKRPRGGNHSDKTTLFSSLPFSLFWNENTVGLPTTSIFTALDEQI